MQGALAVTKNQITLAGLLELDHSVYFMLYMNVSHLYCLLKEKENAEQAVENLLSCLGKSRLMIVFFFKYIKPDFQLSHLI